MGYLVRDTGPVGGVLSERHRAGGWGYLVRDTGPVGGVLSERHRAGGWGT